MRPLLVACDVYRPAAIDQLKVLAESIGVDVYTEDGVKDPVGIARRAVDYAKAHSYDLVIVDTAGRLAVDEQMMDEIEAIKKAINPGETLFVVDAMTGQDAVNTAKTFNERLDFRRRGAHQTRRRHPRRCGASPIRSVVERNLSNLSVQAKASTASTYSIPRVWPTVSSAWAISCRWSKSTGPIRREKAEELPKSCVRTSLRSPTSSSK